MSKIKYIAYGIVDDFIRNNTKLEGFQSIFFKKIDYMIKNPHLQDEMCQVDEQHIFDMILKGEKEDGFLSHLSYVEGSKIVDGLRFFDADLQCFPDKEGNPNLSISKVRISKGDEKLSMLELKEDRVIVSGCLAKQGEPEKRFFQESFEDKLTTIYKIGDKVESISVSNGPSEIENTTVYEFSK